MKRKYLTLKFRNFCGRQRQGFVLFCNQKLPELILQDILFQLFESLYKHILCPEIYYFTHAEEILNYEDLWKTEGFIYVHFLERVDKYKAEGRIQESFKMCDLGQLARGIGIKGCRLFIFSERQYAVYGNSRYCQIVKERITDLNHSYDRIFQSSTQLKQMLTEAEQRSTNQTADILKNQIQTFGQNTFILNKMEMQLIKAQEQLKDILKQVGLHLTTLQQLKD